MDVKRLAAVCVMLTAAVFCSCSGKSSDDSSFVTTTAPSTDEVPPVQQETPKYTFPSFFVDDVDNISLYRNLVANSFDSQKMNAAVTEQPFSSMTCETSFLSGTYYSYVSGDKKGIVSADGNIMLSANYTEIVLVRPDTFLLTTDSGAQVYAMIEENGVITPVEEGGYVWFESEDPIQIKLTTEDDDAGQTGAQQYYLESARGKIVYSTYWDYIETITLDIPSTAAFSAYLGEQYYYIVFDKYYNYKIYEGSYGTVEVSVGGQTGRCFILSSEHLNEISSMLDSFGAVNGSVSVPGSSSSDYVQFVFGNTNRSEITISSDGFCYIEEIDPEGMSHKYFTVVDKLCFSDVVNWIDKELSQEYTEQ